jgi:hypothetical protein
MGNTKRYYVEGELMPGVTLEKLKEEARLWFHSTYCVAEIVEKSGGYLGVESECGPFVVAAIHSFSLSGDEGPEGIAPLIKDGLCNRIDTDWGDEWYVGYSDGKVDSEFRCDIVREENRK